MSCLASENSAGKKSHSRAINAFALYNPTTTQSVKVRGATLNSYPECRLDFEEAR